MPNIKSAKKRVKVIQVKTLNNQIVKTLLKTSVKKFESAVLEGDKAKSEELLRIAIKKIDQSVAKGILHKNTAARKKSQLMLHFNRISA